MCRLKVFWHPPTVAQGQITGTSMATLGPTVKFILYYSIGRNSFFPATITFSRWNSLPAGTVEAANTDNLKSKIRLN